MGEVLKSRRSRRSSPIIGLVESRTTAGEQEIEGQSQEDEEGC